MNAAELIDLASGERFPLEGGVTVGREGCDIVLEDEQVSRRHAAIRVTPRGLVIEDLGSRNGTFVNGEQLDASRPLQPGDTVEVGDVRLQVEMAVTKAAPVMPTPAAELSQPRGDVPPPELEPQPPMAPPMPRSAAAAPAPTPTFERGGSQSRGSAARRGGATAVSLGVIAATVAALIAYFADRGL